MIIAVHQIDKHADDIEFKRLYLCSSKDIIKELEEIEKILSTL
jgi:hypothetical protein